MPTTIKLRSPKQLGPALRRLGKGMDKAAVKALRKTAQYGRTQALRTSATTRPRPRATGTYERSFVVTNVEDGAILSNSARHAIFVEVGRRSGRQPPVKAIQEWVMVKKIARNPAKVRRIAIAIALAIGKRGIRGRYVLKRTMPKIAARLQVEMSKAMKGEFERQA